MTNTFFVRAAAAAAARRKHRSLFSRAEIDGTRSASVPVPPKYIVQIQPIYIQSVYYSHCTTTQRAKRTNLTSTMAEKDASMADILADTIANTKDAQSQIP